MPGIDPLLEFGFAPSGVREEQGRDSIFLGAFPHIGITGVQVVPQGQRCAENKRQDAFAGEHQAVRFEQIFHGIVQGHALRPGDSPPAVVFFLGLKLVQPHVGVDVNQSGGKKTLELVLIDVAVKGLHLTMRWHGFLSVPDAREGTLRRDSWRALAWGTAKRPGGPLQASARRGAPEPTQPYS